MQDRGRRKPGHGGCLRIGMAELLYGIGRLLEDTTSYIQYICNRSVPRFRSPLPLRERVRERVQMGWGLSGYIYLRYSHSPIWR